MNNTRKIIVAIIVCVAIGLIINSIAMVAFGQQIKLNSNAIGSVSCLPSNR